MKNIKYAQLANLSCLYDYAPNTYAVKNSNYAILIANILDNGKIGWVPLFIDLRLFRQKKEFGVSPYLKLEEFFDRIPEEAQVELMFNLDLIT